MLKKDSKKIRKKSQHEPIKKTCLSKGTGRAIMCKSCRSMQPQDQRPLQLLEHAATCQKTCQAAKPSKAQQSSAKASEISGKTEKNNSKQPPPAKTTKNSSDNPQECPRASQSLPKASQKPPKILPKSSPKPSKTLPNPLKIQIFFECSLGTLLGSILRALKPPKPSQKPPQNLEKSMPKRCPKTLHFSTRIFIDFSRFSTSKSIDFGMHFGASC